MIADNFLPADAIADCTPADRGEVTAVFSRITSHAPVDGLKLVSLDLPDADRRIADRLEQGCTVLALATVARKSQRQAALEQGVHEFLTTGPIEPAQLSARLDLLAGRPALPAEISYDPDAARLSLCDRTHSLNEREAALIGVLIGARGGFVTHDRLMESIWGTRITERQNLRVAINRLRKRVEPEPDLPRYLLAEPAIGYRIGRPAGDDHM